MENVAPLRLGAGDARKLLQRIAEETGNVIFTSHALEQMRRRRLTPMQVLRAIRTGRVTEGPFRNVKGNWQLNMTALDAGAELTATVAIDWPSKAIVVTAFSKG